MKRNGFSDTVRKGQQGFTFAELLAAMVFTAIVIPIALEGIAIANRASVYAERKIHATRLAEQLLNEAIITENWKTTATQGVFENEWSNYRWRLNTQIWDGDIMELQAAVFFPVQNREYFVQISTLVDNSETS